METIDCFVSDVRRYLGPPASSLSFDAICLSLCLAIILHPAVWLPSAAAGESCDRSYHSTTGGRGNFSSPGYPSPYPQYSTCRYFFTGTRDERIRITFSEFDLDPATQAGCLYDYIDIFTIDDELTKNLENRICGGNIPEPFVSIHNRLELVFKSDHAGLKKGFFGHYEFLDEDWQPFPESSPGCGPSYQSGLGGQITSPEYPKSFPPNVQCTWTIRVEHQKKIVLNFIGTKLGDSVHCDSTFISIYNGFSSPTSVPVEKLCNSHATREFRSNSYRVIVRFQSGSRVSDRSAGFRIAWTAVWDPSEIVDKEGNIIEDYCDGFYCTGGEYCIDTSRRLCNPLQHYCISDTLRCNQIPNCGAYDNSDEEGCFSRALLLASVSSSVGSAIFVLFVVLLCFRRRKRLRRRRRSSASFRGDKPSPPTHLGFAAPAGSLLRRPSELAFDRRSPQTTKRPPGSNNLGSPRPSATAGRPAGQLPVVVHPNATTNSPVRGHRPPGCYYINGSAALASSTPHLLRRQHVETTTTMMHLLREQNACLVVPDAGVNIPNSYRRRWDSGEGDRRRPDKGPCSRSRSSDGVQHSLVDGNSYVPVIPDGGTLHAGNSIAHRRSRYLSTSTLQSTQQTFSEHRDRLSIAALSAERKPNTLSSVV